MAGNHELNRFKWFTYWWIFDKVKKSTCERAAGRLRRPLGVPESGVLPADGGSWPATANASNEEQPGAQMDAERPLPPAKIVSALILISRGTGGCLTALPFSPLSPIPAAQQVGFPDYIPSIYARTIIDTKK